MKPGTIALFGNFGTRNLGNECTLQAVIHNIHRHAPGVGVTCICSNPDEVTATYGISALPMYSRPRRRSAAPRGGLRAFLRRLFVRVPQELLHWARAFRSLKGTAILVMTGTGMLGDFGITPGDLHYEILKWSLMAKLGGCAVVFLSVGASHLDHPVSRWLVRRSLSLADYRSFRDGFSRDYLASIGAPTRNDPVYPDLAFSFCRRALAGVPAGRPSGRVVGLGLMDYYGKQSRPEVGENRYRAYVETMAQFTGWLLREGYTVRLIIGDLSYDTHVKADLIATLRRDGIVYDPRQIIDDPVASLPDLLAQLAATDVVVATRFHNVLLSLLLNKPVISISYDQKNDAVMAQAGLLDYCQPIDLLNARTLIQQLVRLEANRDALKADLPSRVEQQRQRLEEQYTRIFGSPAPPIAGPALQPASATNAAGMRC